METIDRPAVPPAVPRFLNLDEVAPPALRDEIQALIPEALELAQRATDFARRACVIRDRKYAAEEASGINPIDDFMEWVDPLTGWADVDHACAVIDGAVETVRGGSVSDDFYEQCARELGIPFLHLRDVNAP